MHSSPHWRADPSRSLVFMFSGQGSHYYQMGQALYEQQPVFRRHMTELNLMAQDICGADVLGALYDGARRKHHLFDDLRVSHPAIFMVEYALAATLIACGVRPDGVLGVSMGNFAAATVAGCMTPEQALEAIGRQARALLADAAPGGMLALLGQPTLHQHHAALQEHSEIAAVNTPASFVLALPESSRITVEHFLREHNINFQRMAVARAFHSRWIDDAGAAAGWHGALAPSRLPWYCATLAGPVAPAGPEVLWDAVRQPIRMLPTLRLLEQDGRHDYLDLSPSGTLAVVLKYLLAPGSPASYTTVMSAFGSDLERFEAITGRAGQH